MLSLGLGIGANTAIFSPSTRSSPRASVGRPNGLVRVELSEGSGSLPPDLGKGLRDTPGMESYSRGAAEASTSPRAAKCAVPPGVGERLVFPSVGVRAVARASARARRRRRGCAATTVSVKDSPSASSAHRPPRSKDPLLRASLPRLGVVERSFFGMDLGASASFMRHSARCRSSPASPTCRQAESLVPRDLRPPSSRCDTPAEQALLGKVSPAIFARDDSPTGRRPASSNTRNGP